MITSEIIMSVPIKSHPGKFLHTIRHEEIYKTSICGMILEQVSCTHYYVESDVNYDDSQLPLVINYFDPMEHKVIDLQNIGEFEFTLN